MAAPLIKGGSIAPDDGSNRAYYGEPVNMRDILFDHKVRLQISRSNWPGNSPTIPSRRKSRGIPGISFSRSHRRTWCINPGGNDGSSAFIRLEGPAAAGRGVGHKKSETPHDERINMKTLRKGFVVLLLGGTCLGTGNALANLEVSASVQIHAAADFEAPLGTHGAWVTVRLVWPMLASGARRGGLAAVLRGHWVWTDCGWYWSRTNRGRACYHYGTWVDDPAVGWVWVPGVEWAPAWVEWRVGGGFIGWAPLAPRGVVLVPGMFGFVEIGHFHERIRPTTLVINNTTIINRTTRINEVSRETRTIDGRSQQVVVNHGPKVEEIQKARPAGERGSHPRSHAAHPAPKELSAPDRSRETGNRDGHAPADMANPRREPGRPPLQKGSCDRMPRSKLRPA